VLSGDARNIAESTALVTGANRGLGLRLARQLMARGAPVYAGSRDPDRVDLPGVKPSPSTSPIRRQWRPRQKWRGMSTC
jgi:NAD(P)-dependent dehydrogenase (short-subunit alcohol dehydrogenase family)